MKILLFIFLSVILLGTSVDGFPLYHDIPDLNRAQAESREKNLPLAWLGLFPEDLDVIDPQFGGRAELEIMALATLKDHAVIIVFDGRNMAPVPAIVHAQFHIQDDGPLPGGANWSAPKVVFTNSDVSQVLGRVSRKQMGQDRDQAITKVLATIRNNAEATSLAPATVSVPVLEADLKPSVGQGKTSDFFSGYGYDVGIGVFGFIGVLVLLHWWRHRSFNQPDVDRTKSE